METKVCFKCLTEKPISEYYAHSAMADGHLNKCKGCTKRDTKERDDRRRATEPNYFEVERKRGRNKYHRLYEGTGKANPKSQAAWVNRFPEKRKAQVRSGSLAKKKPFEGAEIHHWSYKQEFWKDVIWLTKKDHNKGHRFLIYDSEQMMYRRTDNLELLDTKNKHEEYIKLKIKTEED